MMFTQSRKPSGGFPLCAEAFSDNINTDSRGSAVGLVVSSSKSLLTSLAGALSFYSSAAGAEEICLAYMTESDISSSSTMGLECRWVTNPSSDLIV